MYTAPITAIASALHHFGQLDNLAETGQYPNFDHDLILPILEEAGKLACDILAPINMNGDKNGAILGEDGVIAAPGFSDAYKTFRDGGWMGLSSPETYGGQGLPHVLALAVMEIVHGANMAFGLCPMLSFSAIEVLLSHGSEAQKATYLPKLISGQWTGTMHLTETQSGSDLATLKTKAVPNDDGSYAISGQKIYITWGDHDMTENIIHLVLARLPDAPQGSKGISLFVCPKYFVNQDGSLGARNSVKCIGLEEKLGIHASPTCVMEFAGAKGWLVGEPNRGLATMFTMMNAARLGVALEGVGIGEAAMQTSTLYANERKQGRRPGHDGSAAIIHHPDIQHTLANMSADVSAMRAICLACGAAAEMADRATDPTGRRNNQMRTELLTPIAKAWSTDLAVNLASQAVQIHGGMGFMAGTLAAQLYRDSRILPIYEGTNGIQAIDLAGRKLSMHSGAAMRALLNEMRLITSDARQTSKTELAELAQFLDDGVDGLEAATHWMSAAMQTPETRDGALFVASDYLALAGQVIGGGYLLKAAIHPEPNTAAIRLEEAGTFITHRVLIAPAMAKALTIKGQKYTDRYAQKFVC